MSSEDCLKKIGSLVVEQGCSRFLLPVTVSKNWALCVQTCFIYFLNRGPGRKSFGHQNPGVCFQLGRC